MSFPASLKFTPAGAIQPSVYLDPSSRLGGLLNCAYMLAHTNRNLIGAHSPLILKEIKPTGTISAFGPSVSITTAGQSYAASPIVVTATYPFIAVYVGRFNSTTGTSGGVVGMGSATAGGFSGSNLQIVGGSSTSIFASLRNNFVGSGISLAATAPGSVALNAPLVVVWQSLSATDHRICVSGGAIATSTTDTGAMVAWSRPYLGNASNNNHETAFFGFGFNKGKPLTDAEMQAISGNVSSIWDSIKVKSTPSIWVPQGAAGGLTVSTTPGDAVAAGAAATVSLGLTIAASPGAAVAAGSTATVSLGLTIAASPGAAVAAGATASVSLATTIAASPGAAVAAGATATVSGGLVVSATPGDAVAAGAAATVSLGLTISASVGAAVAAGATATVTNYAAINATVGAAVAAGSAATVLFGQTLQASIGAAVAEGAQATIIEGYPLTVVNATVGAADAGGMIAEIEFWQVGSSTGSVLYIPLRSVSGLYTAGGVTSARAADALRAALPHSRQRIMLTDGTMDPTWYRFFQVFVDVFLGGVGGLTIADIVSAIETSQADNVAQSVRVSSIETMAQSNAQTLQATVEVVQANALVGAEQIPQTRLPGMDP